MASFEEHVLPVIAATFAAAMGFVIIVMAGCDADRPVSQLAPFGGGEVSSLPPVTLVDAAGVAALLNAARGTVVVVNLCATWCPPCVTEMPIFAAFYRRYPRTQVSFFSISADTPATIESRIRPFQKEKLLPFPIFLLAERDPTALDRALQIELSGALPTTLVYNRTGKLVKSWTGEITQAELDSVVQPLLDE